MTDNRSERLRRRRKRSKERGGDTADDPGSEQGRQHASATPSERSPTESDSTESESDQEIMSVKEQQVGTYMYLPETQTMALRRLYNILKAEYEFEYDEEFEKNRHFYPLVVQYGLEGLDGLDAPEIRERLENTT